MKDSQNKRRERLEERIWEEDITVVLKVPLPYHGMHRLLVILSSSVNFERERASEEAATLSKRNTHIPETGGKKDVMS